MKLIPHNKNVGLVFFGALILTATFLFFADKVGGKSQPSNSDSIYVKGQGQLAEASASANETSNPSFGQVDWQNTLGGIAPDSATATVFTPSSLQVTKDSGPSSLRTYAADLRQALKRYEDPKLGNEVGILLAASKANDATLLAGIDTLEQLHTDTLSDLLGVSVPADVAVYHAQILNAVKALAVADEGMKQLFSSPNLAQVAVQAYAHDVDAIQKTLQNISALLVGRGIKLANAEKLHIYLGVNK
ncbi:MAG: hypothetical protein WC764_02370 [Candidatus Paceibacterota bacterium]|jgi:hypothetical protein